MSPPLQFRPDGYLARKNHILEFCKNFHNNSILAVFLARAFQDNSPLLQNS